MLYCIKRHLFKISWEIVAFIDTTLNHNVLKNKTTLAIKFFKGVVNSQIKVKVRICTFLNPDDILYISRSKKIILALLILKMRTMGFYYHLLIGWIVLVTCFNFHLGSWEIQNILTHKLYICCQQHLICNYIPHLSYMMLNWIQRSYIHILKKY